MIYFVTNQTKLIESDIYKIITVEESLQLLKDCKVLQFDSETDDLDCHIGTLLSIQFGNKEEGFQIVVDCTTVDVKVYKDILEKTLLVGHNLKFDLQWLYNYGIIPLKVYDTMIVEQLLYLGYPYISLLPEEYREWEYDFPYVESFNMKESLTYYSLSFSLKALVLKYLNQDMDKSVRGNIIYEGLSDAVILYAAHDVELLEDIMWKQVEVCKKKECINGAKLECNVVPAMAYLEWCGIKLDADKWKAKMKSDEENLDKAKKALDDFVVRNNFTQFYKIDNQGDLFSGFNLDPIVTINWSSSRQVVNIAKLLGFNTTVQDKKTGEDKDSVLEKQLKTQKGINDEFLDLYFKYQEYAKVCTTYGQGHLNTINPNTGRSHTVYNQLKTASGRLSCGSSMSNKSLAKLNKVPITECSYPNYQQLPADEITRSCFVAEEGNLIVSADFSAEELAKILIHI
jgi:DNA polymerase I-like protein with 3'-5' exonuclease and polymerase domains